jgi:hypothetical protein
LGGWVFNFQLELGVTPDVVETFMEAVGEVTAVSVVEVTMKEPKQISTWSVRMSTMLAGEKMPNRVAMLHSEFLISPTWRTNCQGVRPAKMRKGLPKRL